MNAIDSGTLCEHRRLIIDKARSQGIDADLVKTIMYMETTHGYYDTAEAIFDASCGILPMNVRSDYWRDLGFTRQQLNYSTYNSRAGVMLLKRLPESVQPKDIESIASIYQNRPIENPSVSHEAL